MEFHLDILRNKLNDYFIDRLPTKKLNLVQVNINKKNISIISRSKSKTRI